MSRHLSTRNISSKSTHAFLSNLAHRQTDRQTDRQTKEHVQKHISQTLLSTTPCVKQQNEFQSSQLQNISTRWMNGTKTARNELDSKSCRPIRLVPVFASSCTLTLTIVIQDTVSWPTVNLFIVMFEMLVMNGCI